jgi:hypothetical protein
MNKRRSNTQYLFQVDLRPQSELRGVALLGHQKLAELHENISEMLNQSSRVPFCFHSGNVEIKEGMRLDDLNLRVGQTFEYMVNSIDGHRHKTITVDFIDNE